MLEVINGSTRNQAVARELAEVLHGLDVEGSFYIGYPVLATADETIGLDGLLVSREHGLTIFLFADFPLTGDEREARDWAKNQLDRQYVALENSLSRHDELRVRRTLGFQIHALAVLPTVGGDTESRDPDFVDLTMLTETIREFPPIEDGFFRPLQAALERVTTIKPRKKRQNATTTMSRGSILKRIEREIANLDQWQKRAVIESPEGPQRIRGLAGSGKTIVLALKAAYLHVQHPEWIIAVTFHTRSLYQQFEDLVRRFSFEHQNDEPNWDNLRILHAWGGRDREGLYTQIAKHAGVSTQDYLYARERYGMSKAFEGVCSELLAATRDGEADPIYDAVLVDEAQDLPIPFFRLIHRFTRDPKRIVWAYDDLQKLSEVATPTVEELFGTDERGQPLVGLANPDNSPHQDIVLKVCYRNPHWILTVAHACGFGIYRPEGLVQHFDDPSLWTDIGYNVVDGDLQPGRNVTLERAQDSYPEYFRELLRSDDVVKCKVFDEDVEQANWVARQIERNLETDELDHDDILVILPNTYTAKRESALFTRALNERGIHAHLAGVTSSRDEIFTRNSIALANIHRSKGNEAAMVYLVNAQHCLSGPELVTLRNTLFTAITRSRAWIRVCGWGQSMRALEEEIRQVTQQNHRLVFQVPTDEELSKIRQIHRELTASERERVQRTVRSLSSAVEAFEKGELDIESLPLDLRAGLAKYFAALPESDYDDT